MHCERKHLLNASFLGNCKVVKFRGNNIPWWTSSCLVAQETGRCRSFRVMRVWAQVKFGVDAAENKCWHGCDKDRVGQAERSERSCSCCMFYHPRNLFTWYVLYSFRLSKGQTWLTSFLAAFYVLINIFRYKQRYEIAQQIWNYIYIHIHCSKNSLIIRLSLMV